MLRVQPRKPGPPPPRPAPSDPPRLKKVFLWPGRLLSAGVDPNATPQKRLPSATRFLTSPDSAHRVCGSSREDSPPRALALVFFPALIRNNGTACHEELGGGPQRPDLPYVFCPPSVPTTRPAPRPLPPLPRRRISKKWDSPPSYQKGGNEPDYPAPVWAGC
ncbi:uncharacterized protein LOC116590285 isoform X2 [Mustela erminea]|uniref:uncharacterized protein LOC116590285 isoform X2 n=1 Tax=Mustela erminea TaxID=36723 RepID=UPI0013875A18|nr:uncharacterized protein LOC116590285 isoform X2 [Mustela erminea]